MRLPLLLALSLLVVPGIAACSSHTDASAPAPTAAVGVSGHHTMPNGAQMSTREIDAAWAARPAFVRQTQRIEMAYAYAFRSWNVIEWMPCYCGCDSLGHGSNLNCFLKPMRSGSTRVEFDEHGSYCGICIDIALTAKKLAGEGKSLLQIRQAIDRQFGSAGPGTDTALPPA